MKKLAEWKALANRLTPNCTDCGTDITGQVIQHYNHFGGWNVSGFDSKLWLYIECPGCGYGWSLWKLGVPREQEMKQRDPTYH